MAQGLTIVRSSAIPDPYLLRHQKSIAVGEEASAAPTFSEAVPDLVQGRLFIPIGTELISTATPCDRLPTVRSVRQEAALGICGIRR